MDCVQRKFPVTLKVQRASVGRWTECMSDVGEKNTSPLYVVSHGRLLYVVSHGYGT